VEIELKRRVLHILFGGLGGHGAVFFSMVEGDRNNYFNHEALFSGIEPTRKEYIDKCEKFDINHFSFQTKNTNRLNHYLKVYSFLKKRNPDVILLHGSTLIIPAVFYKLFKKNTKIILRETQAHHLKTFNDWILFSVSVVFADIVVFLSKQSMDEILSKFTSKKLLNKFKIIPNGLDANLYKPFYKCNSNNIYFINSNNM
jgi:hypothetical protein